MIMKTLLTGLFAWMPIIFGIGFVAPVTAALLEASGIEIPMEANPLEAGLAVGFMWGLVAKYTGRWV